MWCKLTGKEDFNRKVVLKNILKHLIKERNIFTKMTNLRKVGALILLFLAQFSNSNYLETEFSFEDLRGINGSCSSKGTCQRGRNYRLDLSLNWKEVNCFCDDSCIEYGDCCLQAKVYDRTKMADALNRYECVSIYPAGSFYMKGKCMEGWADKTVEEFCLMAVPNSMAETSNKDPFIDTPVTSVSSDVTYKNYFCAVCNNESLPDLQTWHAQVTCPDAVNVSESYIRDNVRFAKGTWGVSVDSEEGSVFRPCDISPVVAETVEHKIRNCENYVTKCSPDWTDAYTENLCQSYTTVVYGPSPQSTDDDSSTFKYNYSSRNSLTYRNYHCAMCNFVDASSLLCSERSFREVFPINPVSLSVLFDFGAKKSPCPLGNIWDPFSKHCRSVVCFKRNQEYRHGRCVTLFEDVTIEDSTENVTDSIVGGTNRTCDKMFLNNTDFTYGLNQTIIVHSIRRSYSQEEYETYKDGVLVCIPNSYSRLMGWLTLFGLGLSSVCLVLHLAAFLVVPDLRNLSGKNLASLCVSLLAAYVCFLITTFKESGTDSCPLLASVMYYFFLSSFVWMNVMAFDIWRTLEMATSKLRVTSGEQWKKFFCYSLYSWLLPGILLAIVMVIDRVKFDFVPPSFIPELGEKFCWFGQRNALIVFFAAPLALIMIVNIFFFIMAVRIVAVTANSSSAISAAQPHQVQLKLYLRLALLMGLSWISGIVGGFFQEEYLWYAFIILNAFQGLYILIAFTCTKKVRRVLKSPKSKIFKVSLRDNFGNKKHSTSSRMGLTGQDSNDSQLSNTNTTNLSNSGSSVSKSSFHSP